MGEAFALSERIRTEEQARIFSLRERLWQGICHIPGVVANGSRSARIAGNLNVSFVGVDGEALIPALHELAVSTSSACATASREPSYVLRALGISPALAKSSIRLSVGRFTTTEQVNAAIDIICREIPKLQQRA